MPGGLIKWPTLSDRRTYLSLVECYKIVFGYCHLNFHWRFLFNSLLLNLLGQIILSKLYVKSTRLNCYKHSAFFLRIVKLSNDLPKEIVETEVIVEVIVEDIVQASWSLRLFKSKLKFCLNVLLRSAFYYCYYDIIFFFLFICYFREF